MGILRMTVFWSTFLLLFVTSKALVTLAVASCNDEALTDDDACFQFPIYQAFEPFFDTDLSFDPDFIWFNNTTQEEPDRCKWYDAKCHIVRFIGNVIDTAFTTAQAIIFTVVNLFKLIAEAFTWLGNAVLEIINFGQRATGLLVYAFRVGGFFTSIVYTFIPGAPWYVNVPFVMPIYIGSSLVVVKLILTVVHGDN